MHLICGSMNRVSLLLALNCQPFLLDLNLPLFTGPGPIFQKRSLLTTNLQAIWLVLGVTTQRGHRQLAA